MATVTVPSSSSPLSPPSASHSESSGTHPTLPKPEQADALTNNGVVNAADRNPDSAPADHFAVLDDPEYIEKYKKYEVDYTHRLMAKYFSKKNIYGDNIFEEKTTIDNETILSSRWPFTRSFADPLRAFEDQRNGDSTPVAESPIHISNGKHLKKND